MRPLVAQVGWPNTWILESNQLTFAAVVTPFETVS